ncbi:hypothetical protein JQ580_25890 [Bradyrhizobium japonicum]|nr:hypothetical protein [Bradyrhizobium japonicum]MBR0994158.1 hypothetical protein [Bradyrhizobium japonicum]
MGTKLGNAKRARRLARLFEKLQNACDQQDEKAIAAAKRAIDALIARRS